MKAPFVLVLLLTASLGSGGVSRAADAAAKAPASPPLSPRFKQVRDRIDALFHNRNETPTPPDPRLNPFRAPGLVPDPAPAGTNRAPGTEIPAPKPPGNDITLLQQSVATLKVSGTFEKDGRSYLVINAKPYKENDVIQTQVQGESVYLRIRQITRDSVTLLLNEAETTLKF